MISFLQYSGGGSFIRINLIGGYSRSRRLDIKSTPFASIVSRKYARLWSTKILANHLISGLTVTARK